MTQIASGAGRLARAFTLLGVDPATVDAEALADVLWLARALPVAPSAEDKTGRDETDAPRAKKGRSKAKPTDPLPRNPDGDTDAGDLGKAGTTPRAPDGDANASLFVGAVGDKGEDTLRASRTAVPAAELLPARQALERALRPFSRRYPSPVLRVLDSDATAHESASRGRLSPVFKPRPERWFDVALVLDVSEPAAVWEGTARELKRLFTRHGAFRQVRLWRLSLAVDPPAGADPAAPAAERPKPRIALRSEAGAPAGGRAFASTPGRQLVLLLTHGSGPLWRSEALAAWARDASKAASLAVVQWLPPRAWPFTLLGDVTERLQSVERAAANERLAVQDLLSGRFERPVAGDPVRLPLLPLDPAAVEHWARFVMAPRRLTHAAVALEIDPAADAAVEVAAIAGAGAERPAAGAGSAQERVARFRGIASPAAFMLLRWLSAAPVTLPVMRLLQRAGGLDPAPAVLAEVLLSGLLTRLPGRFPDDRPEDTLYEFPRDVQRWLWGSLSGLELRRIDEALAPTQERIRAFVESSTGRAVPTFSALVLDAEGLESLPAAAIPFVTVSRRLFEMRGLIAPTTVAQAPADAVAGSARGPQPPQRVLRIALDHPHGTEEYAKALFEALRSRGHVLADHDVDLEVAVVAHGIPVSYADALVEEGEDLASAVARLEALRPQARLFNWPAAVEDAVDRSEDVERLRTRLQALRPGTQMRLRARPLSGAKRLVAEVLLEDGLRSRFPGGLFFDFPPPEPRLRRGPALIVRMSKRGRQAKAASVDAWLDIVYLPQGPADIGYLTSPQAEAHLRTMGVRTEPLLRSAARAHMGIPMAVPMVGELLRLGWSPGSPSRFGWNPSASRMPVEKRLDQLMRELLATWPPAEKEVLFQLAALERLDSTALALPEVGTLRRLAWLTRPQGTSQVDVAARDALARLEPGALRAAHRRIVDQLVRGEGPWTDEERSAYASEHLLRHAYEGGGYDAVVQLLRTHGWPAALRTNRVAAGWQLRNLPERGMPAALRELGKVFPRPTEADSAKELARLFPPLAAAPAPWRAPSGTGIAAARQRGLHGRGVRILIPSTGVARLPDFRLAQLSGALTDTHGHGTEVASLIAGAGGGVAPEVSIESVAVLNKQGGGEVSTLLKLMSELLARPVEQLPHLVCWAMGIPVSDERFNPLERELMGMFDRLSARGVLSICAAGNEGPGRFTYPAVFPGVLAVGACDVEGTPAEFSSRGTWIPAGTADGPSGAFAREVPDVYGYGIDLPVTTSSGKTLRRSGTSFATAYVCGIAALRVEAGTERGAALKQRLIDDAEPRSRIARFVGPGDADAPR